MLDYKGEGVGLSAMAPKRNTDKDKNTMQQAA